MNTTERAHFEGPVRRFPATGTGFLITPVLWFAWFVLLYAAQGAGCAVGLERVELLGMSVLRLALGAFTVLVAVAIAVIGLWSFAAWERLREQGDDAGGTPAEQAKFLAYGALLHAALFFVAVIWSGVPLLMVAELCAPMD